MSAKVVIFYKSMPQYRQTFFERLRAALAVKGIELVLVYGQPVQRESVKGDSVELAWAHKVNNVHLSLGSRTLIWQPVLRFVRGADLIIVEQASKLLINHLLWAMRPIAPYKLAFWGHGRNFQGHTSSVSGESLKAFTSRSVDWWFSYNDLSTKVIHEDIGFPIEKITTVQNAIDTAALRAARKVLTKEGLDALKRDLGLKGSNVAIYTGGMYEEKRLPFLLETCMLIKQKLPDFEILFLGSGVDKAVVERAAAEHDWIHYLGPKFGAEKVPYFALAKLMLLPGLVGLGVLDSFSLGVPLVTTDIDYHSPEIDYLVDGTNGLIVKEHSADAYANAVIDLMNNDVLRKRMVINCVDSSKIYTLEAMVERFAQGVQDALSL